MESYSSVIGLILLFVDGLIFGFAVKKGLVSIVLLVIGIVLAGAIGISIPFLSTTDIMTHVFNIVASQYRHIGPLFTAFPILWIVGFGIGIWRG